MATVTGLTKDRMLAIEAESIVGGTVNGSGHLILTKHDGTTIDAGDVHGPIGPTGSGGYVICTSTTRPGSPTAGEHIYETDTGREYVWTGSAWSYRTGGTNPTYARAYRSSAYNAPGGWSTIDLDGESYDYGNNHTAAGGYIVPETRLYDLSARVRINANNDPQQFVIGLAIAGVDAQISGGEITGHSMVGGENFALVLSTSMPLNVGDSVKLQVYNGQSGVCPVTASSLDTWMAIRAV